MPLPPKEKKHTVVQARINNCQYSKLKSLQDKLKTRDSSETMRAIIDISYSILFEKKDKYLINFYNIKDSLLYQWIKGEEKND